MDDVGAVAEQIDEELAVGQRRDQPLDGVVEAVQRVDPLGLDEQVQQARHDDHGEEPDQQTAEEQQGREGQPIE